MRRILIFWGVAYFLIGLFSFSLVPFVDFGLRGFILATGIFGWLAILCAILAFVLILFMRLAPSYQTVRPRRRIQWLFVLSLLPFVLAGIGCIIGCFSFAPLTLPDDLHTYGTMAGVAIIFFLFGMGALLSLTCISTLFVKLVNTKYDCEPNSLSV